MFQGLVRLTIIVGIVAFIAATSAVGMGLLITGTQQLTMSPVNTDDTFYADLTGDCDDWSVTCG